MRFVMIACADDWEEAYQSLRQIVMEDLLLEEEEGQRRGKVSTSTGGSCFVYKDFIHLCNNTQTGK